MHGPLSIVHKSQQKSSEALLEDFLEVFDFVVKVLVCRHDSFDINLSIHLFHELHGLAERILYLDDGMYN